MKKFICIRLGLNFGKVDKRTVPNYMDRVVNVFINYTLQSLINQTEKDFTLVFVYGELLKDIHKTKIQYHCKLNNINFEFTDNKIQFFENLKDKTYISIRLDADDYIHPTCIEKVCSTLRKSFNGKNIIIVNPSEGYLKYKDSYREYKNNHIALCMGMISSVGENILNFNHVKIIEQLKLKYKGISVNHITLNKEKLFIYNREEFSDSVNSFKKLNYNKRIKSKDIENYFKINNKNIQQNNQLLNNESVSICIPAYKAKEFIEECLDSIENQSYFKNNNNYEILIGIDGCEETLDKINEIKHKYRNLRIFFSEKNMGTYITQNTIIHNSRYEKIIIFNADDIMNNDMVEEGMLNIKKFDVVGFKYKNFNNDSKIINSKVDGGSFSGIMMMNKCIWKKLNGFSPWKCGGDSDFRIRVANAKIRSFNISKPLFLRRIHENSLTQNKETGYGSDVRKKSVLQCQDNRKNKIYKIDRIHLNNDMIEFK